MWKKQPIVWWCIAVLSLSGIADSTSRGEVPLPERDVRLKWFKEARFGLFIHWGVYSVPAGEWKGLPVNGIGEQIMRFAQIPVVEYEQLTPQFNPVRFNADEWVKLAKDAGMKYIVLTAKHHDGFAMFHSKVDPFNIVDAAPFGRDVVKEMADACAKAGLKFCVYYSQRQDWHHPDGAWKEWPGQYSRPIEERGFDFNRCMNEKCIPQMEELLTRYGPLGLVWYDTAVDSTPEQSRRFTELVNTLQPDCLVCDRVGNGYGDYAVLGDNEFPYCSRDMNGEVPATMNHTWGYKKNDQEWKDVNQLLYSLIRSAANGCNYLLNVGPTAEGVIPPESVERLQSIGQWMKVNGEAIYGAGAAPFPYPFPWGMMTVKGRSLYLIFSQWPGPDFRLNGLKSKVLRAVVLADPSRTVGVMQRWNETLELSELSLSNLPAKSPESFFPVIRLELDGIPQAEQELIQAADGSVTLLAGTAQIQKASPQSALAIDRKGLPVCFRENSGSLLWTFRIFKPGRYRIEALTNRHWSRPWIPGIKVTVQTAGTRIDTELKEELPLDNLQKKYHPETVSLIGVAEFASPGTFPLNITVSEMPLYETKNPLSEDLTDRRTLNLIQLRLVPEMEESAVKQ